MISVISTFPIRRLLQTGLWFAGIWIAGTSVLNSASPATQPSEIKPLAEKSLLLDIAVLAKETIVVGERGHILKTRDNGNTWQQIIAPTQSTLTNIFFIDDLHGWASGHSGVLLNTKDGGESWTRLTEPDSEISYFDSLFMDQANGLLIGAYGEFARTHDGGLTLEKEWIDEEEMHFYSIKEDPGGTLYIVGEMGQILRSTDGGKKWRTLDSPYSGSFFDLLCLRDQSILVFGLRGHIFRSTDAGDSWQDVKQDVPVMLTSGVVLSTGTVLIAGLSDQVFMSGDQGKSFHAIDVPGIEGTVAVAETASENAVLLCGRHGVQRVDSSILETALREAESNHE